MIKCTLHNEAKLHKLYYKVCMKKQSCQSKVVSPGILYLKKPIHEEMRSRVAGYTNQVGGDFRWQPATFDNPDQYTKNH